MQCQWFGNIVAFHCRINYFKEACLICTHFTCWLSVITYACKQMRGVSARIYAPSHLWLKYARSYLFMRGSGGGAALWGGKCEMWKLEHGSAIIRCKTVRAQLSCPRFVCSRISCFLWIASPTSFLPQCSFVKHFDPHWNIWFGFNYWQTLHLSSIHQCVVSCKEILKDTSIYYTELTSFCGNFFFLNWYFYSMCECLVRSSLCQSHNIFESVSF